MTYRWLTDEEIETLVNPTMKEHGWAELNINPNQPTCCVLGAFLDSGELLESFALQMYPILGPMVKHMPEVRDSGETSRQLAETMYNFLKDVNARGYMVVASSPMTERLCERYGMKELDVPVFVSVQK